MSSEDDGAKRTAPLEAMQEAPVAGSTTIYSEAIGSRYDHDFQSIFGGQDRGDLAFFEGLARAATGPLCEVGAGTGRVLLPVARSTAHGPVTAIDPSPSMRARLAARLLDEPAAVRERVVVVDGRFEAIPLPDASQSLVYAAFRSFQHILTVEGQLAALAEMRRVVAPGGTIAFDLFEPDPETLTSAEPWCITFYDTGRETLVERWDARTIEPETQLAHIDFTWVERDAEGAVVSREEARYTVRFTHREELRQLLARAGWRDVSIYAGYDFEPLDDEACELIVVMQVPR